LFIVYRPSLIPEAASAIERWRDAVASATGEIPMLLMAQAYDDIDPRAYGFDGAVEFPPHKLAAHLRESRDDLELLDPAFAGTVRSYDDLVDAARNEPVPPYPLIRTVTPSWDNEARRPGLGLSFAGQTPAAYEEWLRQSIRYARDHPLESESLVFVNAWNEWAEGAYLEPDVHFGWAYLNATGRAVYGPGLGTKPPTESRR
jgi:hypothetical protein